MLSPLSGFSIVVLEGVGKEHWQLEQQEEEVGVSLQMEEQRICGSAARAPTLVLITRLKGRQTNPNSWVSGADRWFCIFHRKHSWFKVLLLRVLSVDPKHQHQWELVRNAECQAPRSPTAPESPFNKVSRYSHTHYNLRSSGRKGNFPFSLKQ